ncbi:MAG: hypothetical protein LC776_18560, partial [Acidobacteria bacterium]|nr:hypothetical protein [Acidobacteriota bacterium]
ATPGVSRTTRNPPPPRSTRAALTRQDGTNHPTGSPNTYDQAMGQGIDVVWWKIFEGLGRDVNLEDVRKWMEVRASDMPENDSEPTGW